MRRAAHWMKIEKGKNERRRLVSPFCTRLYSLSAHYAAAIGVSELEITDEQEGRSVQQEKEAIQEWKRKRREARWASQPSKAPLDSQESCVVS